MDILLIVAFIISLAGFIAGGIYVVKNVITKKSN